MRARVDSGEFSHALRSAAKYSRTTGLPVSECVLLTVDGDALFIRTTTGSEDCIARVNVFSGEDGQVTTLLSVLLPTAFDSGGFVDIYTDGTKLVLEYNDALFTLGTFDKNEGDFPVWLDAEEIATVSGSILKAACGATQPFDKTGHPLKSAVHFISRPDDLTILATDGIVGYIRHLPPVAAMEKPLSIEATQLWKAISTAGDMATVSASKGRVVVSTPTARISFGSMICSDQEKLIKGFYLEGTDAIEIGIEELRRIALLCRSASIVDERAEMKIDEGEVTIIGRDVDIRTTIDLELPLLTIFHCSTFVSIISSIGTNDPVKIVQFPLDEHSAKFWYIDGDDGRRFIYAYQPAFFADGTSEQAIGNNQ